MVIMDDLHHPIQGHRVWLAGHFPLLPLLVWEAMLEIVDHSPLPLHPSLTKHHRPDLVVDLLLLPMQTNLQLLHQPRVLPLLLRLLTILLPLLLIPAHPCHGLGTALHIQQHQQQVAQGLHLRHRELRLWAQEVQ